MWTEVPPKTRHDLSETTANKTPSKSRRHPLMRENMNTKCSSDHHKPSRQLIDWFYHPNYKLHAISALVTSSAIVLYNFPTLSTDSTVSKLLASSEEETTVRFPQQSAVHWSTIFDVTINVWFRSIGYVHFIVKRSKLSFMIIFITMIDISICQ